MNILHKIKYTLNKIENQENVGPYGESTYDLASELITFLFQKKDNPVPSLDIKIIKDIRNLLESQIKNSYGSEMDDREYMIEYLNELLQNGVETDKDKPKKCFCKNNDKTCINCY